MSHFETLLKSYIQHRQAFYATVFLTTTRCLVARRGGGGGLFPFSKQPRVTYHLIAFNFPFYFLSLTLPSSCATRFYALG